MVHQWGPVSSLVLLGSLFSGVTWWAVNKHYELPTPVGLVTRNDSRISEAHILDVARHLSETIGYRTVGTKEHAQADQWIHDQARAFQQECEEILNTVHFGRHLECEVWRQQGSGMHRFDIMGHRLYKNYVNLTNIIIRLSNGTDVGKEHALLVNAHVDSTPPSPGAADDALAVGVMLECLRVLLYTKTWEPSHAILFLFNNAEESLQDASHLYSTQHPTASTVRAVINLEAAGTKGPELLFQATSEEMVLAYAKVPHPYGTVLANDVFRSGIVLSDTDFRQFEQYLNVTGVDMAVVGHSYFYHTQKDLVEFIEPGVAQHMGENTLSLLHHFTAPSSPLPSLKNVAPHRPHLVYFSLLGSWFFTYTFRTASSLYLSIFIGAVVYTLVQFSVKDVARGLRNNIFGLLGAITAANAAAVVMKTMGKEMSWFAGEGRPLMLYGPPAVMGALLPQLYFSNPSPVLPSNEFITLITLVILFSGIATFAQNVFQIGSAGFLFVPAFVLFLALLLFGARREKVPLSVYVVAGLVSMVVGAEVWVGIADVFVPLTGRMGEKAPAEFIIASMTAFVGYYTFPLAIPISHRFGHAFTKLAVIVWTVLSLLSIGFMSTVRPFDAMHPKRMYVVHSENITTGDIHLNFAGADGAPGLKAIVTDLAQTFGETHRGPEYELSSVEMTDWNGDWDTLYPFSAFLTPYKLRLPGHSRQRHISHAFAVTAENDVLDREAGTRSLTLRVNHPGVIWTVIAFDAHVLHWSLDDNPPDSFVRHHVKEASFHGVNTWTVDLVIKLQARDPRGSLKVNFVGTREAVQWPAKRGKADVTGEDAQDLAFLEQIHAWLEKRNEDAIDALLFGTLGGVVVV